MYRVNNTSKRLARKGTLGLLLICLMVRLSAQQVDQAEEPKKEASDKNDIIKLPEFDVTADAGDQGYKSSSIFGANRMVVPIEKMDGSAFVINPQLLKDLAPRYLADAIKYVAGVEQPRYYSPWDNIVIRGGSAGTNLVDGFAVRGLDYVPLALVQQVEVIKGSQGVLYGAVSAGGIINRVMKQPEFKFGGELSVTGGSYDYYSSMADITGPVPGMDDTAYRFISSYSRGGGRQKNLVTEFPEQVLEGSLKRALPGGGSITASISYLNREWNPGSEVTAGDPTTGLLDEDYFRKYTVYTSAVTLNSDTRFNVTLEKMLGPIASRFSYQYLDSEWADDALFPCCANSFAPEPIFARYRNDDTVHHGFYYDGVWKINFGEAVANIFSFGFASETDDEHAIQIQNYGPNFGYGNNNRLNPSVSAARFNFLDPNNSLVADNLGYSKNNAFYANWRASFFKERVSVIGGMRYENYEKSALNRLAPASSYPTKEDTVKLYRAGIVAEIVPDLNAYVGYGETFAINTNIGYIPPGSNVGASDFLPDSTAKNTEAGLHLSLWKRKVTIAATYYSLASTGNYRGGNSSFEPIVALPDNTNTGFEFQLTANPNENWAFVASATQAKITDVGGARTPDYSEKLLNAWAKYTVTEGAAKGLGLAAGFNHYGDKVPSSIPAGTAGPRTGYMVPAVTTVDASVSYETGRWLFQFNGRNLGDKVYVTRFGGSVLALWANPGRTWSISARLKL